MIIFPMGTQEIQEKELALRKWFLSGAFVPNPDKGYVINREFNQMMRTKYLALAADLIAFHYRNKKFDVAIGIPNGGPTLSGMVAERLDIDYIISTRKGNEVPGGWDRFISFSGGRSYTTGKSNVDFTFYHIPSGSRVLATEDMIATGSTLGHVDDELRYRDIEMSVGSYVSKIFEGGQKFLTQNGTEVFAAIEIESITPPSNGNSARVNLAPAHYY